MAFADTRTILERVGDHLLALTWTPPGAAEPVKLVEAVAYYQSDDLAAALQALFHFEESMAVIVPARMGHQAEVAAQDVRVTRLWSVDIFFTGRSYYRGDDTEQWLGMRRQADGSWDADLSTKGMLDVAEVVIRAVAGRTLGVLARPIVPEDVIPVMLEDDQSDGLRPGVLLPLTFEAGREHYPIRE